MSDRRYGAYIRLVTGVEWPLSFIPDALAEEAAKAMYEAQCPGFDPAGLNATQLRALARAALSVLFPGHDRNDE